MATIPQQSDVFKFVALRPPTTASPDAQQAGTTTDARPFTRTVVGMALDRIQEKTPEGVTKAVTQVVSDHGYTIDDVFDPQVNDLDRVAAYLVTIPPGTTKEEVSAAVAAILGSPVSDWQKGQNVAALRDGLWDRFYAFYLLQGVAPQNLETLTARLRAMHFIAYLANPATILSDTILTSLIKATIVLPAELSNLPVTPAAPAPGTDPAKDTTVQMRAYEGYWNDLINHYQSLNSVKRVSLLTNTETNTQETTANPSGQLETGTHRKPTLTKTISLKTTIGVNKDEFNALSSTGKTVLKNAGITEQNFDVARSFTVLQDQVAASFNQLENIKDPLLLQAMPEEAKQLPGVELIISGLVNKGAFWGGPLKFPTSARNLIKPLGIGDLKVVKQTLKKYVAGEVAHIENVLKGEYKERKYRTLDRTENTETHATETTEENTHDNQTTDRFELKKESDKTIQSQMSLQAGVTVTASYGPVSIGAHADFAYSTSSSDTEKTSSNFAKEIVDKSVTSIQKKTIDSRTAKQLHEVEELDTHGLDNKSGPGNISGIYRWVDKHYEAQIYNYGKRMMFEFIIPEPAAFYIYAQNNNPAKTITVPNPDPVSISHKDLNGWNYQSYIKKYSVQGVSVPPHRYKYSSLAIDQSGIENGKTISKSTKELTVPDGYLPLYYTFGVSALFQNYPVFELIIGDTVWDLLHNEHTMHYYSSGNSVISKYESFIPVSLSGYDINAFSLNVAVLSEVTPEFYEDWQIKTYEKILAAYQALKEQYDQAVSQVQTNKGVVIQGQNPMINRTIEQTELKKAALKMFMDFSLYGSFDAMKAAGTAPPEFDVFDAIKEGKNIQFYEQAFEWENLTYLFYPYFWGRKSNWVVASNTYDTDPLFTQFLQAGAGRVVVPVHPAFNDAVLYFLERGLVWGGADAPRINDPLFMSIAEELKNQTDDLDNAIPEGDPWDVILPTTLVYLQDDSKLPDYES
jgi:hypothetical protein